MADAWGTNLATRVHQLLQGPRSVGELRNFARTPVPNSLLASLAPDREGKRLLREALPQRRRALTTIIQRGLQTQANPPAA